MREKTRPFVFRAVCLLGALALAALVTAILFTTENSPVYKLLLATHKPWKKPSIFGAFHLVSVLICALSTLSVGVFYKRLGKYLDHIVFGAGLLLLFLELYKQWYCGFVIGNGSYNFGVLPLQFCSYALYSFLLAPLLPEGKIKDALYLFCGLYQTMGGCIVMAYPLLYPQASLCIHSMVWHSVMIATGTLILFARGYGVRYWKELLPPTLIFLSTVTIAVLLNYALQPLTANSLQPLNLFYMSPYQTNNYILIRDVQAHLGWFPALLCYALFFIFVGATAVWGIVKILRKLKILN